MFACDAGIRHVHSSIGRLDIQMSNGHFDMSIRPLDEWTFQMSDGHLDMSICPLDE